MGPALRRRLDHLGGPRDGAQPDLRATDPPPRPSPDPVKGREELTPAVLVQGLPASFFARALHNRGTVPGLFFLSL